MEILKVLLDSDLMGRYIEPINEVGFELVISPEAPDLVSSLDQEGSRISTNDNLWNHETTVTINLL